MSRAIEYRPGFDLLWNKNGHMTICQKTNDLQQNLVLPRDRDTKLSQLHLTEKIFQRWTLKGGARVQSPILLLG